MGKYDGKVVISTALNNKGLEKGIGNISGSLGGLKSVVGKLGGAIAAAFSIQAIVQFGVESSKAAMQLSDALTGLQSILDGQGRSFSDAQSFIEEYTKDGLIPATNAITAYKNLAMRGYDDSQIRQVMMALKDASAYGRQASYTMGEAVQSASEGLKNENSILVDNAGVTKNVAKMWDEYAKSIGTTANNLTQQQKIQAEVTGILEESKYQTGDAAKVAGTLSGRLQQLSFNFNNLKVAVGNIVNPIVQYFLPAINSAVSAVTRFANAIATTVGSIFGKAVVQTTAIGESATAGAAAQEDLADGITESGKAAKKSLASFDELNTLQNNSCSAGPTAVSTDVNTAFVSANTGITSAEEATMQPFLTKIQEMIAPLQNIDFSSAIKAFKKLGKPIKKFGKIVGEYLEWYWFNIFVPLSTFVIEDVLPRFFETLSSALSILGAVLDNCMGVLKQFYDEFLIPIAEYTGEKFLTFIDELKGKLSEVEITLQKSSVWVDLKIILAEIYKVLEPIVRYLIDLIFWLGEFVLDAAWLEVKYNFQDIEDVIGAIACLLQGDFNDAWEHLKDLMWENKIDKAKENADNLKESIEKLITIVSDFEKKWREKIKEIVDEWAKKISAWWTDNVEPWFTIEKWEEVIQGMVDAFANCWNKVYDFFAEEVPQWWDDNIAPWFTIEKWEEIIDGAVEGVKSGWKGFTKFFEETLPKWWDDNIAPWFTKEKWKELGEKAIEGLVNPIIDGLNALIEKLNKFSIEIPEIKGITEGFKLGFDIPQIPKLAQGAVLPANKPFLAMVGDQKHGTNIEAPLDTIKQALAEVMATQGSGDITINFTGDLAQLARVLKPVIERENHRVGGSLVRKAGT